MYPLLSPVLPAWVIEAFLSRLHLSYDLPSQTTHGQVIHPVGTFCSCSFFKATPFKNVRNQTVTLPGEKQGRLDLVLMVTFYTWMKKSIQSHPFARELRDQNNNACQHTIITQCQQTIMLLVCVCVWGGNGSLQTELLLGGVKVSYPWWGDTAFPCLAPETSCSCPSPHGLFTITVITCKLLVIKLSI